MNCYDQEALSVWYCCFSTDKLRMLEFYYDFLDKYFSRQDSELCYMDTDSFYLEIRANSQDHSSIPDDVSKTGPKAPAHNLVAGKKIEKLPKIPKTGAKDL